MLLAYYHLNFPSPFNKYFMIFTCTTNVVIISVLQNQSNIGLMIVSVCGWKLFGCVVCGCLSNSFSLQCGQ